MGFAAANNFALSMCKSKYIVLLNPDAVPDSKWLEELVNNADNNPGIAAFGSRQMLFNQDNILDGTGDVYHFSGKVWRRGFKSKLTEIDMIPSEIFSPCSAAALYRRDSLLEIGGFDSDFFCYLEDVDLGFRLRLSGHRITYVPKAIVYHVGSALTGGHRSDFSIYYGHRNIEWVYIKNMPGCLFWIFLPSHIVLSLFSILYFCLIGKAAAIFKSKKDALFGLARFIEKRKTIQKNRSVSALEILKLIDKRLWFFN
jgi:GT2 family glycosyltransferase